MVEPGASADEIREDIFDTFRSKIEASDMNEDVAGTVLTEVLAEDPPYEFSEEVSPDDS